MPLAAFILVVLGVMALTLTRTTSQTSISATQEGITLQAFYAAESGAQMGMHNLFYRTSPPPLNKGTVNSRCNSLNIANNFTAVGLGNCQVTVSCSFTVSSGTSYYTINSVGSCGSGEITSVRTIEVSAFME